MSKEISHQEALTILTSGSFDGFVGAVENDFFECKRTPYRLQEDHEKQELAKDIAAFANSGGGTLVIGLATERSPIHHGDEITAVRAFDRTLVSIEQYYSVLKSWIYPQIPDLHIGWYATADNPERGLIAVTIPHEAMGNGPYIITRFVEPSAKISEIVIGYVERRRSGVEATNAQRLQTLLRDGLRFSEIDRAIQDLQTSVGELLITQSRVKAEERVKDIEGNLRTRTGLILNEVGLAERPHFALSASPNMMIELPSLFESKRGELYQLVDNPPELRSGGFDIKVLGQTRIVRGESVQALAHGQKVLQLFRDGTLALVVRGDREFLCWGRQSENSARINALALIECTYLFFLAFNRVLHLAKPRPSGAIIHVQLGGMITETASTHIHSGPVGGWYGNLKPAPDAVYTFTHNIEPLPAEPGTQAFLIVSRIYEWFGFPHDAIPYTCMIDGVKAIDADAIRVIG